MTKTNITKKIFALIILIVLAVTILPMRAIHSNADKTLLGYKGPYLDDDEYIATYMREDYFKENYFEIQFKYIAVGTPTNTSSELGFNDTFEFLVFDTNYGGWKTTTVGPNGYDKTGNVKPVTDKVYTVTVPISIIEDKLLSGQVYGIKLQTGGIGTSIVSVVSLKYITGNTPYVQKEFTASGSWTKGNSGSMTVSPKGAATVRPNTSNIEVSAIDISSWNNPTVDVTVTYLQAKNNVQAEILVNGTPVKSNYVNAKAGTYTYSTKLPSAASSFAACYDGCSVTNIRLYNNNEIDYNSQEYIEQQMNNAAATGEALGMPVFLGEYWYTDNNNTATRADYCYWLNYYAAENGIVTAYWDNGVLGTGGTALFDRTNNVITDIGQTVLNSILAGYNLLTDPNY